MSKILIYVLRRDLRLADNPIFHDIGKSFQQSHRPYTHVLPLYVVPAQQVEVSGLIPDSFNKSPFPEARSQVARFWRCGPHRARFLSESVWDLKASLEAAGSGLVVRVGMLGQVVASIIKEYESESSSGEIYGVWMTGEEGSEEKKEERDIQMAVENHGKDFKLWIDEKYFVDDRDSPVQDIKKLPDVFTGYKKMVEPLRDAPRRSVARPDKLPPLPEHLPAQSAPFQIPQEEKEFTERLIRPVLDPGLKHEPTMPKGAKSAHPFTGGEKAAHRRVQHYITSGSATTYKDTRNGMLGEDFSTKFSAWLALGCITARQIHEYLVDFEDGTTPLGKGVHGYGKGENKGTGWVRFELLWRDYFRLCTRKFGTRLFLIGGFKADDSYGWKSPTKDQTVADQVRRFVEGRTGLGLIDASQRELLLTGYTSNRARQNVASFLAKHLGIDWRIGAEWYEYLLTDYDVSSNWGNWQYTAGVGNDPRESRQFNPVKQAFDYDSKGDYVKTWVEELRALNQPQWIFQPCLVPEEKRDELHLSGMETVESPLKKIQYKPGGGRGGGGKQHSRGGGRGSKAQQGRVVS